MKDITSKMNPEDIVALAENVKFRKTAYDDMYVATRNGKCVIISGPTVANGKIRISVDEFNMNAKHLGHYETFPGKYEKSDIDTKVNDIYASVLVSNNIKPNYNILKAYKLC